MSDCTGFPHECQKLVESQHTFTIVSTSLSFALFILLAVVFVIIFCAPCRKAVKFSNSLKALGAFIFFMMLAALAEGTEGVLTLTNNTALQDLLSVPVYYNNGTTTI